MKRDQFEEIFRNKLIDCESDDLLPSWEELERRLPKEVPVYSFPWRRVMSIAAMVSLVVTGSLFYLMQDLPEMPAIAGNASESDTPESEERSADDLELPRLASSFSLEEVSESDRIPEEHSYKPQLVSSPEFQGMSGVQAESASSVEGVSEPVFAEGSVQEGAMPDIREHSATAEEASEQTLSVAEKITSFIQDGQRAKGELMRERKQKPDNRVSLGLLASNFTLSDKAREMPYLMSSVSEMGGYLTSMLRNNPTDISKSEFSHHLPISIGVTTSLSFSDHWSVETGLLYSYHYSTFESVNLRVNDGEQHLYYLGVPVNLNYRICDWKRLRLYAGGGGRVDFNLNASQEYVSAGEIYTESFRDKKPVWSLRLKAGAAFELMKWLEVYAEPGIAHFFTGDRVQSKWRENPTSFDLQFGLRTLF